MTRIVRSLRNLRTLPARFEAAVEAADPEPWIRGLDLAFAGVGFCVMGLLALLVGLGIADAASR